MSFPAALKLRDHATRVFRFGIVSGAGLALDLVMFLALVKAAAAPFGANIISSVSAVSFVYFASVWRIFRYKGRFIAAMFAAYSLYQLCGILLSSWAVSALVGAGLAPGLAKIAILPVTFGCNYLFMWWLTSTPDRWARAR